MPGKNHKPFPYLELLFFLRTLVFFLQFPLLFAFVFLCVMIRFTIFFKEGGKTKLGMKPYLNMRSTHRSILKEKPKYRRDIMVHQLSYWVLFIIVPARTHRSSALALLIKKTCHELCRSYVQDLRCQFQKRQKVLYFLRSLISMLGQDEDQKSFAVILSLSFFPPPYFFIREWRVLLQYAVLFSECDFYTLGVRNETGES